MTHTMLKPSLCHYNDVFMLVKDASMLAKDTVTITGHREDKTIQTADKLIVILIFVIFYKLILFTRHHESIIDLNLLMQYVQQHELEMTLYLEYLDP